MGRARHHLIMTILNSPRQTGPTWLNLLKAIKRFEWVLFVQVIGLHLKRAFKKMCIHFLVTCTCSRHFVVMQAQNLWKLNNVAMTNRKCREYLMNVVMYPPSCQQHWTEGEDSLCSLSDTLRLVNLIYLSHTRIFTTFAPFRSITLPQTVLSSCSFLQTNHFCKKMPVSLL